MFTRKPMHLLSRLISLVLLAVLFGCQSEQTAMINLPVAIIPKPIQLIQEPGAFKWNANTKIIVPADVENLDPVVTFLVQLIAPATGFKPVVAFEPVAENAVVFQINDTISSPEGYILEVSPQKITISSRQPEGAFYALQTLRQLLPPSIESREKVENERWLVPSVKIYDAPRYSYRGLHLDVSRHFFPVETILKYVDLIALQKINHLHWHLTDDQGWRIEIKKYPKLQEIAAYRDETLVGHYNDQPHQFDGQKYGGYYTQDEIREIVAYAESRFITIVPEIEMPGHASAALAAYPELGCGFGPYKTATKWGVFEDVFCPNDVTFQFLEDVMTEVLELFPNSPYIHVGGDECPKTQWQKSAFCQNLIKKEGLKDEHGLQSYFIQRIEKFINSKGRNIIGWDEILEGGLAPNATVMSWRGTEGGIEAAKQGHDVIMTPTSHCYLDYYQSRSEDEPLAIGGFLPLEKVYNYEPTPAELNETEAKHILGVQGNVWTEYIPSEEKLDYMVFPRATALAETGWIAQKHKNYDDFTQRLGNLMKRWDVLNVNYANHVFEVAPKITSAPEGVEVSFSSKYPDAEIHFTQDNQPPTTQNALFKDPLTIKESLVLMAAAFDQAKQVSPVTKLAFTMHKAAGKKITLVKPPHPSYNTGGSQALINGIRGSSERYGDGEWLAWNGEMVDGIIDLEKETPVNRIQFRFFNGNGQWIYLPKKVTISFSGDGVNFNEVAAFNDFQPTLEKVQEITINLKDQPTRYIQVRIEPYGLIPEGQQGAGNQAWLFVDEIMVF